MTGDGNCYIVPAKHAAISDKEIVKTYKENGHKGDEIPRDPKGATVEASMLVKIRGVFVQCLGTMFPFELQDF